MQQKISNRVKLLFVYNANSDFASSVKDTAHKLVSPDTYQCNLCKLTYPLISIDREWKKFVESLPYEVAFLHRDEFHTQYPEQKNIQLPAVFAEDASEIRLLINHVEINKAANLAELIKIVDGFIPRPN